MLKKETITEKSSFYLDDEIDLREWIKIIVKRKSVILLVTAFLICAILIFDLLKPKVYIATSIVRIGILYEPVIKTPTLFEDVKDIRSLTAIINRLGLNITPQVLRERVMIKEMLNDKFAEITVKYNNSKVAINICDILANNFVNKGKEAYQKNLGQLNEEICVLDERIQGVRETMSGVKVKVSTKKNVSIKDLIHLQDAAIRYEEIYNVLEVKKSNIRNQLLDIHDYEIYNPANLVAESLRFGITKNIIIVGITGLILGFFIASFQEFWAQNNSKQENQGRSSSENR